MRQIFNKKQLIVIWIIGIAICIFFIWSSVEVGQDRWWTEGYSGPDYHTDWGRALVYPTIIIGGLLVLTLAGRKEMSAEEIARGLIERDKEEVEKEHIRREKYEEERRKFRDNTFVKSWDRGASDGELVEEFDLTAEEVKKLKTTLLLKRLELRKKKRKRLVITTVVLSFFALIIVLRIVGPLIESRRQGKDPFEEWIERNQPKERELSELDKVLLGEEPKEELSSYDKLILGQPEE